MDDYKHKRDEFEKAFLKSQRQTESLLENLNDEIGRRRDEERLTRKEHEDQMLSEGMLCVGRAVASDEQCKNRLAAILFDKVREKWSREKWDEELRDEDPTSDFAELAEELNLLIADIRRLSSEWMTPEVRFLCQQTLASMEALLPEFQRKGEEQKRQEEAEASTSRTVDAFVGAFAWGLCCLAIVFLGGLITYFGLDANDEYRARRLLAGLPLLVLGAVGLFFVCRRKKVAPVQQDEDEKEV